MLFASGIASAQSMQHLPNGTEYKIIGSSAAKIKQDDVITFNFIQKTDKDSVLMSSYTGGQPVKIQVQPAKNIGDLMEVFTLLGEKDSAVVRIPTDSLFKEYEQSRPAFLPKGSFLTFNLKIEKVQSVEEATAEAAKMMEELKMQEKAGLASYIATNKLDVKATPSGLMYIVTKPSVKPKPVVGDTVYVNYTGKTVDGTVFDSSIEADAVKAGLSQPGRKYEPISLVVGEGQVIKGWDEGLLLFNEGAKGKLLIQSDLAYGPQGAGDAIKPFSSLIFDVEIVKVKHPKKAVTTPAAKKPVAKAPAKPTAKTPAKTSATKPGTTKPATKPAATKAPVKK
ncbi:MAG: peptidylprolyl isomerase [Sphingobacteriaceae bacterium]|nr:peptidylprolyl isomerase [Sphingobacteriaceae bacterium]